MRRSLLLPLLLAACTSPGTGSLSEGEQRELQVAQSARARGDVQGAEELYRGMASKTDSAEPLVELAALYRSQGKGSEAVAVLREAKLREPQNAKVHTALGAALTAGGQAQEALGEFDEALALKPDDVGSLNGKAVALDHVNKHEAAQALYRQALALTPDDAGIQNNLALSLLLSGDTGQAIGLLEPLAASQNVSATIRQNLAMAYGIKGDRKKALEWGGKDLSQKDAAENLRFYQYYRDRAAPAEKAVHAAPVDAIDAKPLAP